MKTYRKNQTLAKHFSDRIRKHFSEQELGKLEQLAKHFSNRIQQRIAV